MVELHFGKPIEELLVQGSVRTVAKRLGVDFSTVSKWKARLGLTWTVDHLPSCTGCELSTELCFQPGIFLCNILLHCRAPVKVLAEKRYRLEVGLDTPG